MHDWLWEPVELMFSNKVGFTPHQSKGCLGEGCSRLRLLIGQR
jgi:hypothetical protein